MWVRPEEDTAEAVVEGARISPAHRFKVGALDVQVCPHCLYSKYLKYVKSIDTAQ